MADQTVFDRHPHIHAFLAENMTAVDSDLPELLDLLMSRSAGEDWHKAGTFKEHLLGTYRVLALWGQPRKIRLAGLFHSVYSNEYVNLKLFDIERSRDDLRGAIGHETEQLVHTLCTMPRTAFVRRVITSERLSPEGMALECVDGRTIHLTRHDVAAIAIISAADIAEQWFSWMDDVFHGYPCVSKLPTRDNWAASVWPGPMRPSTEVLGMLSRLLRPIGKLSAVEDLAIPPVFGRCSHTLAAADEATASSIYWQVINRSHPLASAEAALELLDVAIAHNPWVGEPHALKAQIALSQGDFELAALHSNHALELLSSWGVAWDKRIAWTGWVAWCRILSQSAARCSWPEHLGGHIGLGLVG